MPTYEYRCKSCSHRFDLFQRITDNPVTDCPECGQFVERLISGGGGLLFKGSGFYITDYKNAKPSASGDTNEKKNKTESENKKNPETTKKSDSKERGKT